ncbi:MAG TPA: hypothetical protein VNA30_02490 [Mycobacteriales bacterium]|nr:hypothetical protein [Mycobacteriales bacterium]
MRIRTAATLGFAATLAAGVLSPAVAAPKPKPKPKPVTKSYVAQAFPPDPTHFVDGPVCNQKIKQAQHNEPFTVPFPGTMTIDMTGFQGDWDLAIFDTDDAQVAQSAQSTSEPLDRPEQIVIKLKKKGYKFFIRACNFSGGPTANVKYSHVAL